MSRSEIPIEEKSPKVRFGSERGDQWLARSAAHLRTRRESEKRRRLVTRRTFTTIYKRGNQARIRSSATSSRSSCTRNRRGVRRCRSGSRHSWSTSSARAWSRARSLVLELPVAPGRKHDRVGGHGHGGTEQLDRHHDVTWHALSLGGGVLSPVTYPVSRLAR